MNYELIKPLFDGKLSQSQTDGVQSVLNEWHITNNSDKRQLAYVLATIYHETNKHMQPVEEAGYLSPNAQMAYLQKQKYFPYYGRDLVHTTHDYNYQKVKDFSGIDVVTNPELIGQMPLAAKVAVIFMQKGWYTGKKLSDYFNSVTQDSINARKIINGLDCADKISIYWHRFYDALK